jgi:hypothetical protein
VPRRVGHDELACVGREEPVRDVDRDALLALGQEAVEQEREVELSVLRAEADGVAFERRQMIVEDELRLVQEPADERALAIVDAATRDEAEQPLAQLRLEVLLDLLDRSAQKYPSCFFFSIDPLESRSISRPCRSDVFATNIS